MAYDPALDTCATCRYYLAAEEDGECHRMPPSYIPIQHQWTFASVTAENSCGEFASILLDYYAPKANCH